VWLVNGGRGRFLTPIVNDTLRPKFRIIRYDVECMRPMTSVCQRSAAIMEAYMSQVRPELYVWKPGIVLLMDNRQCLHGRSQEPAMQEDHRVLERVLVAENSD